MSNDNQSNPTQSTFDLEVRQAVPQVVKEVICSGKILMDQKRE